MAQDNPAPSTPAAATTAGAGATPSGAIPAAAAGGIENIPAGVPYYEKSRQKLKELLQRRKMLERQLVCCCGVEATRSPAIKLTNIVQAGHEETIYQKETEYLENTLAGNIITGFDSYTKGASSAAAQRRKIGQTEANRVFSRSSISYNANAVRISSSSTRLTPD